LVVQVWKSLYSWKRLHLLAQAAAYCRQSTIAKHWTRSRLEWKGQVHRPAALQETIFFSS
jgi:hypothetical protein